mmetsp:Transcript_21879/g.66416  ORF Transcript_21879/g.66416 Transcript_21879/m.66416 type:complete len:359 (-) Transcript_21879:455-1531(-)
MAALALAIAAQTALVCPASQTALPRALGSGVARTSWPPRARTPLAREYSSSERLREEVEAPFAKVRLFAWPVLFGAAGIATYFSATGLLASAVGARPPSDSAALDLGIDLAAMATTGWLWRRELSVREARLRRIAFGARLAALRIRQFDGIKVAEGRPPQLQLGSFASLSDLRRGRGQARRVVIMCAPQEKICASVKEATKLANQLIASDFLIVPIITTSDVAGPPRLEAPSLQLLEQVASDVSMPEVEPSGKSAASPPPLSGGVKTQPPLPWVEDIPNSSGKCLFAQAQSVGMWAETLGDELDAARKQDPNAPLRGFTIVLKKNGRIGTRRLGTPNWPDLVFDVQQRTQAGLDVANI